MPPSRSNTTNINIEREPNFGKAQDFEIWEVARAATAAPFYFDPLKIDIPGSSQHMRLTDAGFGHHNNPTKDGIKEMEWMNLTKSIGIVVSIGTARKDEGKLERGPFAFRSKLKDLAKKATDTEMVHEDMHTESEKAGGFQYFRLNDRDGLDTELDEWEPKPSKFSGRNKGNGSGSATLKKIRDAFNGWVSQHHMEFQDCAKALVQCRRARMANSAVWERYATGAEYTCLQGCHRENIDDREQFREHLRTTHELKPQDLEAEINGCRRDWRYQPAPS
ncbi:hypothetical protein MMC22_010741 [Lobaria immixta]|nr:hypothetical protein [Lobaria immixta]